MSDISDSASAITFVSSASSARSSSSSSLRQKKRGRPCRGRQPTPIPTSGVFTDYIRQLNEQYQQNQHLRPQSETSSVVSSAVSLPMSSSSSAKTKKTPKATKKRGRPKNTTTSDDATESIDSHKSTDKVITDEFLRQALTGYEPVDEPLQIEQGQHIRYITWSPESSRPVFRNGGFFMGTFDTGVQQKISLQCGKNSWVVKMYHYDDKTDPPRLLFKTQLFRKIPMSVFHRFELHRKDLEIAELRDMLSKTMDDLAEKDRIIDDYVAKMKRAALAIQKLSGNVAGGSGTGGSQIGSGSSDTGSNVTMPITTVNTNSRDANRSEEGRDGNGDRDGDGGDDGKSTYSSSSISSSLTTDLDEVEERVNRRYADDMKKLYDPAAAYHHLFSNQSDVLRSLVSSVPIGMINSKGTEQ